MKTILYATDCTKASSTALIYAYKLSKAMQAQLHVLHVYDLLPIVTTTVRSRRVTENNFRAEQVELLQHYCIKHLKKAFGFPEITYHALKSESIPKGIMKTATVIGADLTIVSAGSPNSKRAIFSENIAYHLMPNLESPLLILPEDVFYHGYSNFLYATDFEESDLHALEYLVEWARPFGANIDIIHVPRQEEPYHERKMQWFKSMLRFHTNYPEIYYSSKYAEDVESGIHDFIERNRPEMLVMMERPRDSFWEKSWHKDLVKTMGDEIAIPLLVFNKKSISAKPSEEVDDTLLIELV